MIDEQFFAHADALLTEMRNRGIHHISLFNTPYVMLTDRPGAAAYAEGQDMREAYGRLISIKGDNALPDTLY